MCICCQFSYSLKTYIQALHKFYYMGQGLYEHEKPEGYVCGGHENFSQFKCELISQIISAVPRGTARNFARVYGFCCGCGRGVWVFQWVICSYVVNKIAFVLPSTYLQVQILSLNCDNFANYMHTCKYLSSEMTTLGMLVFFFFFFFDSNAGLFNNQ